MAEQKNPEVVKAENADSPVNLLQPGYTVGGRYEIVQRLGRGGMGMVFLALDHRTGEQVALKCVLPQYLNKEAVLLRFEREVEIARKIDHPCVVKIFDAWRWNNMLMYTMEYVAGENLHNLIQKRGKLGIGSTVRILSLLCRALEHAHQFMVHRDISPGNVMVTPDGSVKLLDFGLARPTDSDSALTMIGAPLGKREYMAPEQMINARTVDKRADIFSLGIMFYEMLTGKRPVMKKPEPIATLRPDLPPECDAFFRKATAFKPEDRFADAVEFRHELMRLYQLAQPHKTASSSSSPSQPTADNQRTFWQRLLRLLRKNPFKRS